MEVIVAGCNWHKYVFHLWEVFSLEKISRITLVPHYNTGFGVHAVAPIGGAGGPSPPQDSQQNCFLLRFIDPHSSSIGSRMP